MDHSKRESDYLKLMQGLVTCLFYQGIAGLVWWQCWLFAAREVVSLCGTGCQSTARGGWTGSKSLEPFAVVQWMCLLNVYLKGLGHAILGNFSIAQMIIEWTENNNKIMAQNYRRTQTKHRKAKKGQGWTTLGRIEMDCIWVNLKNVGAPFFKFISVYIKMSFKQLENHSQLLCGHFVNERLLLFDVLTFRGHN